MSTTARDRFPKSSKRQKRTATRSRIRETITSETITISWEGVSTTFADNFGNWFSAQLYNNGVITFFYGGTTMPGGLAGISPGGLTFTTGSPVDWSEFLYAFGNRGSEPTDPIYELFKDLDMNDLMSVGRSGPSRITFSPIGGGYSFFAGTR